MVDIFALAVSHGLLALAVWRLLLRDDLDSDPDMAATPGVAQARAVSERKPVRWGRSATKVAPDAERPARRMIVPGRERGGAHEEAGDPDVTGPHDA